MNKKILIVFCLFIQIDSYCQYTKLFDFNHITGAYPIGDLYTEGSFFYGMTSSGGLLNEGVIFKINPDGTNYDTLMNFDGILGENPYSTLISDGIFLFGVTPRGGLSDSGVIFKIKPDGTGYNIVLDFSTVNAKFPFGSLHYDGLFLYGMTCGADTSFGAIYKIKPDGTGYLEISNFPMINGINPYGTLISDSTYLYGIAHEGGFGGLCVPGFAGSGTIFKIKPDGTSFLKLLDFNSVRGCNAHGSLIFDGTYLYGMAEFGGANNFGTLFKIKTDGTGFTVLLNFSGTLDGRNPTGTLYTDGTYLFGMTSQGGLNDSGTVFKIKLDGTGYTKLHDFGGLGDGTSPHGSLISDGSYLYGMTVFGGSNNSGTIFKIALSTDIEEYNTSNVLVYPTLCDKYFSIESKNINVDIQLFDMLGNTLMHRINNTDKIDIEVTSLPNGIYLLIFSTNKSVSYRKIIVQH